MGHGGRSGPAAACLGVGGDTGGAGERKRRQRKREREQEEKAAPAGAAARKGCAARMLCEGDLWRGLERRLGVVGDSARALAGSSLARARRLIGASVESPVAKRLASKRAAA
ncbi:hypothetical protein GUJ93_ZPchr0001g30572 [Zizania palustris]|uniref:Uncharacterized protein n=1 Tax=Zizania palustris TaxID=103762 RepID=A0A8J5SBM6_ZIZPA|nr:hypothetical protein GUJ93_ZPchr0001g30572 [Zizania palustris]